MRQTEAPEVRGIRTRGLTPPPPTPLASPSSWTQHFPLSEDEEKPSQLLVSIKFKKIMTQLQTQKPRKELHGILSLSLSIYLNIYYDSYVWNQTGAQIPKLLWALATCYPAFTNPKPRRWWSDKRVAVAAPGLSAAGVSLQTIPFICFVYCTQVD